MGERGWDCISPNRLLKLTAGKSGRRAHSARAVPSVLLCPSPAKEVNKMTKKILIIEDDPATQRLVEYSLKQEGYNVITASNGLEGMRKVLNELNTDEAMQLLIEKLSKTKTNAEFLMSMNK